MSKNKTLSDAKSAKNDEFYTQYADIQKEVNAYLDYDPDAFRGKSVLLPCDDPEWSKFTRFFAENFERLGLKKLVSTSYAAASKKFKVPYQPSLFESESPQFDAEKTKVRGKIFVLDEDTNRSGRIDIEDLKWGYLKGDGDFRSAEVRKLRDEADVIVTNPPFSLFREFLAWILEGENEGESFDRINRIDRIGVTGDGGRGDRKTVEKIGRARRPDAPPRECGGSGMPRPTDAPPKKFLIIGNMNTVNTKDVYSNLSPHPHPPPQSVRSVESEEKENRRRNPVNPVNPVKNRKEKEEMMSAKRNGRGCIVNARVHNLRGRWRGGHAGRVTLPGGRGGHAGAGSCERLRRCFATFPPRAALSAAHFVRACEHSADLGLIASRIAIREIRGAPRPILSIL